MTAKIEVHLLGQYTINGAEGPIQLRTDKIKALLAYLLLHPAIPVRRETLSTLFWPDYSNKSARKNLRDALFHLRKTLDQHDPTLSQRCLDADRKTVTLYVADSFVVDTAVLSTPNPAPELAPLIRGELLSGFHLDDAEPFMEWLLLERSRWHDLSLKLLAQWTEQHLQQKEPALAQRLAQRQLALEPWHEVAHRQAMMAYALAHDWVGVAQQFKQCGEVLQTELGIEPGSKTQTLYRELRKKQQALLAPRHNLPAGLSPFVGRQHELTQVNAAIGQRDYRLFTLTGIGGSGKTRLALEVGRQQLSHFPDGVWFVPLASADHVEAVLPAIASTMGLSPTADIPLEKQLYDDLVDKSALLILDNLEQLPEETADVLLMLLEQTTDVVILATSRSSLNVRVERIFPIGGLDFPDLETTADWDQFEAIKLFTVQAARVRFEALNRESYHTVGEICRLLAGSPLAIELAAAQTQEVSVGAIAETLREGVATLATTMRDVPPRQRSMRAVFDYSWRLLSAAQQQGLARLALFRQPFVAEAAQAVAEIAGQDLAALARSSWLKVGGNGRYFFHELLREFGLEQLRQQPNWLEATEQNYVTYHLNLLRDQREAMDQDLSGQTLMHLRQCSADLAQAWHMGVAKGAFAELSASADALGRFYRDSGLLLEGVQLIRSVIEEIRELAQEVDVRHLLASLLFQQARVHAEMTTDGQQLDALEEVVSLAQAVQDHDLVLNAQLKQIDILCRLSQFDEAYRCLEPIYHAAKTKAALPEQARILNILGNICSEKQLFAQSEAFYREGLSLLDHRAAPLTVADLQHNLALTLTMMGRFVEVHHLHEKTLNVWQQVGWKLSVADAQLGLADVARRQGEYELACSYLQASLQASEPVRYMHSIANAQMILGHIALAQRDFDQAEARYQQLLQVRQHIGEGREMFQGWAGLAEVALARGQIGKARDLVNEILPFALRNKISGEDAFWVYSVCYRGLAQAGDNQAQAVLKLAVGKLIEQAEQLTDPQAQQSLLNGVDAHRVLMAAGREHLPQLMGQKLK